MNILLIDDSASIRLRIRFILEELKGICQIAEAFSVAGAVKIITNDCPDLVVLDISLAGESGLTVLDALNQSEGSRPVVVMFTNHASEWYRRKCLERGADYFLNKSHDFDQLREIVAEQCARITSKQKPTRTAD